MTNEIQIIRETKKAKELQIGEVKFWIQNRWLRADGSLTPKGQASFEEASNPTKATIGGNEFNYWSPREGFGRFYFEDKSYLQFARRTPSGSYERHRAAKGETFFDITAVGSTALAVYGNADIELYLPR